MNHERPLLLLAVETGFAETTDDPECEAPTGVPVAIGLADTTVVAPVPTGRPIATPAAAPAAAPPAADAAAAPTGVPIGTPGRALPLLG